MWKTLVDRFDGAAAWRQRRCTPGAFCGFDCVAPMLAHMQTVQRTGACQLLARGHVGVGDYAAAAAAAGADPSRLVWLTLVREPVSRALSEYRHVTEELGRQGPGRFGKAWDYDFTDPSRATLGDWVRCEACQVGVSNRQTRFLAGLSPTGVRPAGESDDDLLAAALRNLERCAFVGTLARFTDSMLLLKETFPRELRGMTSYRTELHASEALGGPPRTYPDELLDELRKRNRLDAAVYARAQELVAARFDDMVAQGLDAGGKRFRPGKAGGGGQTTFTLREGG